MLALLFRPFFDLMLLFSLPLAWDPLFCALHCRRMQLLFFLFPRDTQQRAYLCSEQRLWTGTFEQCRYNYEGSWRLKPFCIMKWTRGFGCQAEYFALSTKCPLAFMH